MKNPSTSSLLFELVTEFFPGVLRNYRHTLDDIAIGCPDIAGYLEAFYGRAAYIIPQLLFEVGYKALTGVEPPDKVRKRGIPFSVICLSLAIADDILDEKDIAFAPKMQLGCSSIVLIDYAYTAIADCGNAQERKVLRSSVTRLIGDVVKAGRAELDYSQEGDFSPDRYLELTRVKTTCYTCNGLRLACQFAAGKPEQYACIDQLGLHLGTFIQLIDDCLDVSTDSESCPDVSTYPAFLMSSGSSLQPALEIAQKRTE